MSNLYLYCRRYITNQSLFDELVESAWFTNQAYSAMGGNAPVMANRFQQEGCHVLLGATATNELRNQMHPDIIGQYYNLYKMYRNHQLMPRLPN